jgi:hypothetical protein
VKIGSVDGLGVGSGVEDIVGSGVVFGVVVGSGVVSAWGEGDAAGATTIVIFLLVRVPRLSVASIAIVKLPVAVSLAGAQVNCFVAVLGTVGATWLFK